MSAGHAVFDTRRQVVLGLAAGAGRGVAVSKTGDPPVYMNMGTAGVGVSFGVGGLETQVVMFFENEWDRSCPMMVPGGHVRLIRGRDLPGRAVVWKRAVFSKERLN
jgi:hypothetical protein